MEKKNMTLSERMKMYEEKSNYKLDKGQPIIARIDGNCFHTFTKGFERPFDNRFQEMMRDTCKYLAETIQDVRFAYVESDEISLVLYNADGNYFFDGRVEKLCSILASKATAYFNQQVQYNLESAVFHGGPHQFWEKKRDMLPVFDCRVFNMPLEDVPNYFLYRIHDSYRNCINVYGQTILGHKKCQHLNKDQLIEEMKKSRDMTFDAMNNSERYGYAICCRPYGEWGYDILTGGVVKDFYNLFIDFMWKDVADTETLREYVDRMENQK